ncbi:MAG: DNA repair protein RecO [Acidimicrobiales bacterium]
MGLYRDQGIVLRTWKLGEADRIVNLLTRGHGKVRAVAKGVRRTKSRFGARLEPTSHVSLLFYEGRELDIITQAEAIDTFRPLRDDFERLARAEAMLEAVDHLAQEREPDPRLYTMLLGALRTLAAGGAPIVLPAFFLKLLALEGFRPVVEGCASCGDEVDDPAALVAFDIDEGGLLCAAHRRGDAVGPDTVRLFRLVLGGRLGAALNEPPSAATHEIELLATRAVEHHLERRIRSVTVLDRT